MPRRRKNGRVVVTTVPQTKAQGRRAKRAAAIGAAIDPRDPSVKLIESKLSIVWLRADASRTTTPSGATMTALIARSKRASLALGTTPEGREERARIATALAFGAGAPLRFVERARVDFAAYALAAAVLFVTLMREHRLDSTGALARAWSHARWQAFADALLDRLGAADLAGTTPKGQPPLTDLFKLADRATTCARGELLAALELQREARDARAAQPAALDVFASLPPREPVADAPSSHDVAIGEAITIQTTAPPAPTPTGTENAKTKAATPNVLTKRLDRLSGCASPPERRVYESELGGWVSLENPPLHALRAARKFGKPLHPELQDALDAADHAEAERANATTNGDQP